MKRAAWPKPTLKAGGSRGICCGGSPGACLAAARSTAPSAHRGNPGAAEDTSGLYRGQICYGAGGATEPAHCFEAQAVVLRNQISGEWPGRVRGVTIYLGGQISQSGEVAIHMHSKRADGSRFAVSDLSGTLHDGRIDATGSFRNGRSVSLNWRKN